MNRYLIPISILALSASVAYPQQTAAPKCPDYSLQLAQGMQAFSDRDAFAGHARDLEAQNGALKQQLKDQDDKLTAQKAIIETLRAAAEPKKDEPAKPEAKP